jgi:predicted NAD-dependent protein-ADP-ribosyltransferase YbiA (DUF1768 family)
VPWARPGNGFTLLFEALALSLCGHLPVSQAAGMLRVAAKRLWSRIEHYVSEARANAAMDEVRRSEMRTDAPAVSRALGTTDRKVLKGLMWGMRKNPQSGSDKQTPAMHWLQHANLRSARAWRLTQALREVCA